MDYCFIVVVVVWFGGIFWVFVLMVIGLVLVCIWMVWEFFDVGFDVVGEVVVVCVGGFGSFWV